MILEFALAHGLRVMNACFEKEVAKKVTYESGECKTVMDYVLVRQRDKNVVQDVKVIRNEPCIPQHKLMVLQDFPKRERKGKKTVFVSKCKIWKLKVAEIQKEYEKKVYDREEKRDRNDEDVEEVWKELKGCLLEAAEEICGSTKGPQDTKSHGGGMMSAVKMLMRREDCMVYGRSQRTEMMKRRQRKTNRLIRKQRMMLGEL